MKARPAVHPPRIPIPPLDTTVISAHANPSTIDSLLPVILASSTLAKRLSTYIDDQVTLSVTPELYWGGDPTRPPSYYVSCLVHATLIGRAYALLNPDNRNQYGIQDEVAEKQRSELWKVMSLIFIKAFWSGAYPEVGSRYAAAVFILTCGHALASTPNLQGKSKDWYVWSDEIREPEKLWSWEDLKNTVLATKKLPQDQWDVEKLKDRYIPRTLPDGKVINDVPEYIPKEVLEVLRHARDHLWSGSGDLSSAEVAQLCLGDSFSPEGPLRDWTQGEDHRYTPNYFDYNANNGPEGGGESRNGKKG
ncbi:MAG: hypothetical protein M1834_004974 [Cirrosporium novae-zelandiae]|nr:MAG: hypothetical protein M1834_004974 [Cirrosporium novae-zelandiae]